MNGLLDCDVDERGVGFGRSFTCLQIQTERRRLERSSYQRHAARRVGSTGERDKLILLPNSGSPILEGGAMRNHRGCLA